MIAHKMSSHEVRANQRTMHDNDDDDALDEFPSFHSEET